tara:strand:- start:407 stop:1438 length:1032 start_codon:yes stop_codon:yes gene_type:complete
MKKISIDKILITKFTKIYDVLQKLQAKSIRCLIVTDHKKKLLGTINDGDIRRAFIKGAKMNDQIVNYYFKKPFFLNMNKKKKIDKNFVNHINVIPIIDKNKKVVDYLNAYDQKNNFNKDIVVIMAGGKGKRLRPFTNFVPKSLLPIKKQTMIDTIISKFLENKLSKIYISVNHDDKVLKYHLSNSDRQAEVKLLEEKKRLGTVGALGFFNGYKNLENVIVTNCDIILNQNYKKVLKYHKDKNLDLTIVTAEKIQKNSYGVCEEKNGKLLKFIEKPKTSMLINIGFYILNVKILNFIKKNKKCDFVELLKRLKSKNKKVGLFKVKDEDWFDVGQWDKFDRINKL